MIELPRRLAGAFRAVLGRCLTGQGSRGQWPLLLCRADEKGLSLHARAGDVWLRYRLPGRRPGAALAFRADGLRGFEGRADAAVTLEEVAPGRGRASWAEGGGPRSLDLETVTPDGVPDFPADPPALREVPEGFLAALGAAAATAARGGARPALSRVQLRGAAGQVVATDGRQLLVQGGFRLPWPEDVLVPTLPALGTRDVPCEGAALLGRTETHVLLRVGPWDFALATDRAGRFPDARTVLPAPRAITARLALDPQDAALLLETLPRLPGADADHAPVTLDLGPAPAVRSRGEDGSTVEVPLPRSAAGGPPARVVTARRYLLRALQLGFTEVGVVGAGKPLCCRDADRAYVWMALDAAGAVPPDPAAARPGPPGASPSTRRTTLPPDTDSGRGAAADPKAATTADAVAEAEALRGLLQDGAARAARLLAALKQQKRQTRAVEAAVATLRQLRLDG